MDDATWGCFEEGWQEGAGCDADHLKDRRLILMLVLRLGSRFLHLILENMLIIFQPDELAEVRLNKIGQTIFRAMQPKATGLIGKSFDIEGYQIFMDEEVLAKSSA